MEALLKAAEALLADIREMRRPCSAWFGPFSESRESPDYIDRLWRLKGADVEWPNLAYTADALEAAVAQAKTQPEGVIE